MNRLNNNNFHITGENKLTFFNYFLVYFFFALGGVTTFSSNSRFTQVFFIFLVILFLIKKVKLDKEFIYINIYVAILYICQWILFDVANIVTIIALFYTFFIPYAVIKIVGSKFTDYYINITYFFAIVSFFFLIPSYLSQDFHLAIKHFSVWLNIDSSEGITDNFIFYNYEEMIDGIIRNTGPFYEPGAFGTFLIVALVLNLIKTKNILEKKNIIFLIAIISTFSTATYLAVFILIFFFFTQNRSIWVNAVLAPILFVSLFQLFSRLPFLQNKIEASIEASAIQGDERIGRIQGAKIDLQDIEKSPLFGRGLGEGYLGSNNGITGLFLTYGITGLFMFFFLIIKSLRLYCKKYFYNQGFAIYATISFALVLFGQVVYSRPIFLGLMMMFILYKNSSMIKQSAI